MLGGTGATFTPWTALHAISNLSVIQKEVPMSRHAPILVLLASAALAQTAPQMEFEVASVKASGPPVQGRATPVGCKGGPGTEDPAHLICGNVSAAILILRAYGITNLQLTGPEWLRTTQFDIAANVPAGTTKEQVAEMWRNLLAERFRLKVHHESKETPQFDLVVAKNGPKLKPAPDDGAPPKMGSLGRRRQDFTYMHFPKTTMAGLASTLSNQANQPVNDVTGLTGNYDVELSWNPDFAAAGPDSPPELSNVTGRSFSARSEQFPSD
jgi:uncharacterized protein (TIGR03435 family)